MHIFGLNLILQERKSSVFNPIKVVKEISEKVLMLLTMYCQTHKPLLSFLLSPLRYSDQLCQHKTLAPCILTRIFNSHLCYLKFNNRFSHILCSTQKRGFKFERVLWFVQEHSSLLHAIQIWGLSLLPAIKRLLKNQKPVKYYSLSKSKKKIRILIWKFISDQVHRLADDNCLSTSL